MNKASTEAKVAAAGGLTKVSLGDLRKDLGWERLGRYVLAEIRDTLREKGLGYFPASMLDPDLNKSPRQGDQVWVYVRDGGPRAQVLDAVLDPDNHDVQVALAGLSGDTYRLTAEQKVQRIRQIVGDLR